MANAKISALTEETAPISTDIAPIVDDPAGTPVTKKATLANIIQKAHGLSNGAVVITTGNMAVVADVDATELGYLNGVTSSLQTQLDAKAATSHTHTVSNISDLTATATELNYTDGVTSNIQTQLDAKAPLAGPTFTGTTTADLFVYDAARGKVTAGGNLGAAETINFNDETNYTGNLDADITFTFSNATSGDEVTLFLTYSGAQRTITWPTITWLDNATGTAPTAPAATGNVLIVTIRYIGTTYYGSATGNYAVYA